MPKELRFGASRITATLVATTILGFTTLARAEDQKAEAPAAVSPEKKPTTESDDKGASTSGATESESSSSLPKTATSPTGGETDESRAKLANELKDKKFAPNTDITDPRLRAQAGSLSRYSLQATLDYRGSPIGDISSPNTPNPDHMLGPHKTSMNGLIGGRFRFDRDRAMSAGTGFSALTPFNGIQRFDVSTPFLSFDITRKVLGIQARASVRGQLVTTPEYRDAGQVAGTGFNVGGVYMVAQSRFGVSLDAGANYNFYNRGYIAGYGAGNDPNVDAPLGAGGHHRGGGRRGLDLSQADVLADDPAVGFSKGDGRAVQSDFRVSPGVQYKITDNVNIATSASFSYVNLRSTPNQVEFTNQTVQQRLGVGWAYRRDIYVYPNVNFYPTQFAWNTASANLSLIFSLL